MSLKKITVEEFKQQRPKQENTQTISYYHDDILNLKNNGYKLKDIVDFLEMNGFKTNISNISRYLKKNSQKIKSPTSFSDKKEIQPSKEKTGIAKKTKYQPDWAKKKGLATPEELLSEE